VEAICRKIIFYHLGVEQEEKALVSELNKRFK
jgi:hypothetical protein